MGIISRVKGSSRLKKIRRDWRTIKADWFLNNRKYLPQGIDRIYHVHIRKSAGTSFNSVFFSEANLTLNEMWREPIYVKNGRVFVQHQKPLIEQGNYFFASSHFQWWNLNLPENTFTFTILRDPYERLVSLYRNYAWITQVDPEVGYAQDPSYYVLRDQKHLLNRTFGDFIQELSNKYLYNQLNTFSENLDVEEAMHNLAELNRVYFIDQLDDAIRDLKETLNLKKAELKRHRTFQNVQISISTEEEQMARALLKDEYRFYNEARAKYANRPIKDEQGA